MDMPFITRYSMTFPYISGIWAWVKWLARLQANRQLPTQPSTRRTRVFFRKDHE